MWCHKHTVVMLVAGSWSWEIVKLTDSNMFEGLKMISKKGVMKIIKDVWQDPNPQNPDKKSGALTIMPHRSFAQMFYNLIFQFELALKRGEISTFIVVLICKGRKKHLARARFEPVTAVYLRFTIQCPTSWAINIGLIVTV